MRRGDTEWRGGVPRRRVFALAIDVVAPPASKIAVEAEAAPALAAPPPRHAIGVLGGTFDPIHFGHLRFADEVAESCSLSQIRLVPAGVPPHRVPPHANPQQRFEMTCLAVENNSKLAADQTEIFRQRPCYTVETLAELRAEFGSHIPICLLLGADAFRQLTSWRRWQQLFELAHLIVSERPGFKLDADALTAELRAEFDMRLRNDHAAIHETAHGAILVAPITALDISATSIRARIEREQSVRYLLPDIVLDYIQANHLYRAAI